MLLEHCHYEPALEGSVAPQAVLVSLQDDNTVITCQNIRAQLFKLILALNNSERGCRLCDIFEYIEGRLHRAIGVDRFSLGTACLLSPVDIRGKLSLDEIVVRIILMVILFKAYEA